MDSLGIQMVHLVTREVYYYLCYSPITGFVAMMEKHRLIVEYKSMSEVSEHMAFLSAIDSRAHEDLLAMEVDYYDD